jgi:hypothetical protein
VGLVILLKITTIPVNHPLKLTVENGKDSSGNTGEKNGIEVEEDGINRNNHV